MAVMETNMALILDTISWRGALGLGVVVRP